MGLRIFGGIAAALLTTFVILLYRRGQLRRGELLTAMLVAGGLTVAATIPSVLDPLLSTSASRPETNGGSSGFS